MIITKPVRREQVAREERFEYERGEEEHGEKWEEEEWGQGWISCMCVALERRHRIAF